jgi:hypothetical protein
MVLKSFALLVLPSAMLLAQNATLSDDARTLLRKPRVGTARLTLTDGQALSGRILRVTDAFISFLANTHPPVCENVEFSKIATVQWVHIDKHAGAGTIVAEGAFLGAVLAPFLIADAVADPFKRFSPPLKPLSGTWESRGQPGSAPKASLVFKGTTVRYSNAMRKQGRWSIEHSALHLSFGGEPERIAPFHFDCNQLILETPDAKFQGRSDGDHADPPIVGYWHGTAYNLDLKQDGTVTQEDWEVRDGSFENTATGLRIHWTNATGTGGLEWIGQIKHRHIVMNVGGTRTEYHYLPPGMDLDL